MLNPMQTGLWRIAYDNGTVCWKYMRVGHARVCSLNDLVFCIDYVVLTTVHLPIPIHNNGSG